MPNYKAALYCHVTWIPRSLFLSVQFDNIKAEVTQNTEALQAGKTELNELRRLKQTLEIDLQGLHNMVRYTDYTNYPPDKSLSILQSALSPGRHVHRLKDYQMCLHEMFSACLCACMSTEFTHYSCAPKCF